MLLAGENVDACHDNPPSCLRLLTEVIEDGLILLADQLRHDPPLPLTSLFVVPAGTSQMNDFPSRHQGHERKRSEALTENLPDAFKHLVSSLGFSRV